MLLGVSLNDSPGTFLPTAAEANAKKVTKNARRHDRDLLTSFTFSVGYEWAAGKPRWGRHYQYTGCYGSARFASVVRTGFVRDVSSVWTNAHFAPEVVQPRRVPVLFQMLNVLKIPFGNGLIKKLKSVRKPVD